jgi:hypothetical protein
MDEVKKGRSRGTAVYEAHGVSHGKVIPFLDCITRTPPQGASIAAHATALPPAVTAHMLASRQIENPGVWGPESVVPPQGFFHELFSSRHAHRDDGAYDCRLGVSMVEHSFRQLLQSA